MINKTLKILPVLLIAGCSSAPEPTAVKWNKAAPVNNELPDWKENNVIISSPSDSAWSTEIHFSEMNQWTPETYYAIAHADAVKVTAPPGEFFRMKNWLRQNGAYGLIQYQPAVNNEIIVNLSRTKP